MKKKVSIILLHYNQPEYVETALDSIFIQTYKNIEIIFADDASTKLNLLKLKDYCKKNNKKNYNIIWQINKENIGTVKNVNHAVEKSTGEYILIFAADDKLYDKNVIKNMVNSFTKVKNDVCMVSSQCCMMDKNLQNKLYDFVDKAKAQYFNSLSAWEQFKIFTTDCFFAMGATMIKADILKKEGMFDERYKFIEDWSSFLSLTKKGYKFFYDDSIIGLLHRDGGISHNLVLDQVPDHILGYRKDLVNIYINEIFPHFGKFNNFEKNKIISIFENNKQTLLQSGGFFNKKIYMKFKLKNILFFIKRKVSFLIINRTIISKKLIKKSLSASIITILLLELNMFFNKKIFNLTIYFLLFYILVNLLMYVVLLILYLLYLIKNKLKRR